MPGKVVHTTRVSKWGMTQYEAVEVFTLDANGKDLAITRDRRLWPSPQWRREVGESRGEVDPSGTRASYVFAFFGTHLLQTAVIEELGVRIVQETEWCHRKHLLERQGRRRRTLGAG
jgi:hypothetical protein